MAAKYWLYTFLIRYLKQLLKFLRYSYLYKLLCIASNVKFLGMNFCSLESKTSQTIY